MFLPPPKLRDFAFVVFSDDWGRHPSSCQHLFNQIGPHCETLWVNTIGLRIPRLTRYDVKRTWEVLTKWFGRGNPDDSVAKAGFAPKVLRPIMLPFFQWRWAQRLNGFLILRALRREFTHFALGKKKILVSTLPMLPFAFRSALFASKVYYCVDDFTMWHGMSGDTLRQLEAETLSRCDLLVATSSRLFIERGRGLTRTRLLTHGVDQQHFARQPEEIPLPLRGLAHPILGMFGVFDQRVDEKILLELSKAWPRAHIVVLGPLDRDIRTFAACSNIHFLGPVPYAGLPEYVASFDVCILPYRVDETTVNINPLKLKEYLATGKPVVSTPLPEAEKLGEFLQVADRDHFVAAVAEALEKGMASSGRAAFLAQESWENKAKSFCGWIADGL